MADAITVTLSPRFLKTFSKLDAELAALVTGALADLVRHGEAYPALGFRRLRCMMGNDRRFKKYAPAQFEVRANRRFRVLLDREGRRYTAVDVVHHDKLE